MNKDDKSLTQEKFDEARKIIEKNYGKVSPYVHTVGTEARKYWRKRINEINNKLEEEN